MLCFTSRIVHRDGLALIAGTAKPKPVPVFVAAIGTAFVIAGCSGGGVSQDEFDAAVIERDNAVSEVSRLTEEKAAAEQDLATIEERVVELEDAMEAQGALAEAREVDVSEDLSEAERLSTEALADKEEAESLVAELTLAYSDDLAVAMTTLANGATAFACDWGTAQATSGQTLNSVTGRAALAREAGSGSSCNCRRGWL